MKDKAKAKKSLCFFDPPFNNPKLVKLFREGILRLPSFNHGMKSPSDVV